MTSDEWRQFFEVPSSHQSQRTPARPKLPDTAIEMSATRAQARINTLVIRRVSHRGTLIEHTLVSEILIMPVAGEQPDVDRFLPRAMRRCRRA